jgi:hypothetical protein
LLRWFATYNVVWLPQEVRVDCKKSLLCGLQKKQIHIIPVCKKEKKCLIDIDCTL